MVCEFYSRVTLLYPSACIVLFVKMSLWLHISAMYFSGFHFDLVINYSKSNATYNYVDLPYI